MNSKKLATAAVTGALYAVLTVTLAPFSYGPVQFRVAEALTLLPFYLPETIPGLFVGCLLANLYGGSALDIAVGSLATLAAAWLSHKAPRLWLAALPPVLVNMVAVGWVLSYLYSLPLPLTMLQVGAGQAGVCYIVGYPLMLALEARGFFKGP